MSAIDIESIDMESTESWVVLHGGRAFRTTAEMARIFARQANRVIESGNPELVVLRHADGIDMVLVTDRGSFDVRREAPPQGGDRPGIPRI